VLGCFDMSLGLGEAEGRIIRAKGAVAYALGFF
jgi:hypothetical protein